MVKLWIIKTHAVIPVDSVKIIDYMTQIGMLTIFGQFYIFISVNFKIRFFKNMHSLQTFPGITDYVKNRTVYSIKNNLYIKFSKRVL